ncbi:glycerol-3-phosphate responsive antiterminator [Paenibacillus sp. KACC 21273]|uniref:glycerol-3-phosphate responsive antiterminator n=1 Tax=Paenibacillus sp. KACC 21273 TaxID=3025665 RepID=UPI002365C364|nr:glycerol-3-phosphate responsive antiterminator [Paenibacillus sp. KACC 21273]WDF51645.1 glycerol-3-phosphate responsive antiterminator [Paenibacillus sp. KACC 21273]
MFHGQAILPAAKSMKQFEQILSSSYEYGVFLDTHIAQLKNIYKMANHHQKKMFLHADLVHGLKNDEYAAEYLCQEIRPYGIISTRGNMILKAKQKGVIAIQRVFMLDTIALEKSYALLQKTQPDYIEVLPGVVPHMIKEVIERTNIPVFAGGLIRTANDVEQALAAGATAVTTSNDQLFAHYRTDK